LEPTPEAPLRSATTERTGTRGAATTKVRTSPAEREPTKLTGTGNNCPECGVEIQRRSKHCPQHIKPERRLLDPVILKEGICVIWRCTNKAREKFCPAHIDEEDLRYKRRVHREES
jgi:predicted RNA-binding Zn-ribbon protein involved in translation (DUF1610 family)